jgi:hypothetical protein
MMVSENYSIDIEQIVVIVLVENMAPTIFIKPINTFRDKVNEIFITGRPQI